MTARQFDSAPLRSASGLRENEQVELITFVPTTSDNVFPTCWSDLTTCLVRSESAVSALRQFRLRAFASWGINPPADEVSDQWDEARRAKNLLLCKGRQVTGAIRILTSHSTAEWGTSPASHLFGTEACDRFREESWVDVSRVLICRFDGTNAFKRLFALIQNVTAVADDEHCRFVLAPTRADQKEFLLSMGFFEVARLRSDTEWWQPCVLLALDWQKQRSSLLSHHLYRYMFSDRNHLDRQL